jgi:hypothetical protein
LCSYDLNRERRVWRWRTSWQMLLHSPEPCFSSRPTILSKPRMGWTNREMGYAALPSCQPFIRPYYWSTRTSRIWGATVSISKSATARPRSVLTRRSVSVHVDGRKEPERIVPVVGFGLWLQVFGRNRYGACHCVVYDSSPKTSTILFLVNSYRATFSLFFQTPIVENVLIINKVQTISCFPFPII